MGLAAGVAPGEVIGIDLDQGRVEEATTLAKERGADNVTFQQGNVYELPFPDDYFDAAYEHSVFQHLDDPVRAAREVHRVLKPGGIFGASDKAQAGVPLNMENDRDAKAFFEFFLARSVERGSDLQIGFRLTDVMREAGFEETRAGANYEVFQGERLRDHAAAMAKLLGHPSAVEFGLRSGLADQAKIDSFIALWARLREDPNGWHALTNGEALGWK